MARTKLTVHQTRRLPEWLTCERATPRQQAKRTYPYKIKLTLPEQKRVDIKKNKNVIKTISVRRRSKYFNDSQNI